ncbi:MAG: hypothetical protein IANPNBLG_00956 [Bryobacteraceae bacterium]|nr:hypothetical protein [Bryobacteraceae bacterium]MCC6344560.1 hypothetical protein [Bryobacterales bacterium]
MKLSELRRLTIRKQMRIRFTLSGGSECLINEHGIAQVPGLQSPPDFNLEQEVAQAAAFRIEYMGEEKTPARAATVAELQKMVAAVTPGAAAQEHEE